MPIAQLPVLQGFQVEMRQNFMRTNRLSGNRRTVKA